MGLFSISDGVLVREIDMHSQGKGQAQSRIVQPSRDLILNRNAELRKSPGAVRPLSFMGLECTIPQADWWALCKKYPDLASPDTDTQQAALRKFLASREADIYRVQ